MANTLLYSHITPSNFDRKWAGIAVLVAAALGASLCFLPVHWVIALLIGMVMIGYLALNPDKAYCLVIFTIPFTERARILPVSFTVNELLLFFTAGLVVVHMILRDQNVRLATRLDGWILLLTAVFFLGGFFSEAGIGRGMLAFFKFFEAVLMYYLTVYFIRTHQVTRASILKILLLTATLQAMLGVVQSMTGRFGADYLSNRGYLGYLGLGSSLVWHGQGTMKEFNTLGNFLATIVLLYAPLWWFVMKRKRWGLFLGAVLMLGLITTYSRGSLLGLLGGMLYILWQIPEDRKRAAQAVTAVVGLFILPAVIFFANSSYIYTVGFTDRLRIWQVPWTAITANAKAFWLGSGLNAYEVVAWPYIPANVPMQFYNQWFAHNFYLITWLEVGLLGALAVFGGLTALLFTTWRRYRDISHRRHFMRVFNLSLGAAVIALFLMSIFDHSYSTPYFRVLLLMLLGILYAVPNAKRRRRPAV